MTTEFWTVDRVLVSLEFYRAKEATETVSDPPAEVRVIGGTKDNDMTRQELSRLCTLQREFCSRCNGLTSSCCILGIHWDIKGEALG